MQKAVADSLEYTVAPEDVCLSRIQIFNAELACLSW